MDDLVEANWMINYLQESKSIDQIDATILYELVKNSRISYTELAKLSKVSRPTVKERIEKLEIMGIVQNFTTSFNYDKCGLPVTAFILVGYNTSNESQGSSQKVVAQKLSELNFVRKVNIITGNYDFLIEISIDHMNSLADVIIEQIRALEGVGNTITMVSFAEYRYGHRVIRNSNPIQ